jgi:hypothetical protein
VHASAGLLARRKGQGRAVLGLTVGDGLLVVGINDHEVGEQHGVVGVASLAAVGVAVGVGQPILEALFPRPRMFRPVLADRFLIPLAGYLLARHDHHRHQWTGRVAWLQELDDPEQGSICEHVVDDLFATGTSESHVVL